MGGTGFIETKEYYRFKEFCDACSKFQYIGLCYGPPGVGKTLSACHYAQWDKVVAFWQGWERKGMALSEVIDCDTVFFTASAAVANAPVKLDRAIEELRDSLVKLQHLKIQEDEEVDLFTAHDHKEKMWNSPNDETVSDWQNRENRWEARAAYSERAQAFIRRCRDVPDPVSLIIVDEVDLLKMSAVEQLRAIFDRGGVGLVLIGMPGLEKRLARYPQLYSRVGFVHEFRPLSKADVRQLLKEGWLPSGVTLPEGGLIDEEAIATLIRVTGGKFRLLHRMLTQISRVLQINQLDQITVPVIEAARESLVIGTA
jgi:DNA transposition AAA+ family ATPase